MYHNEALYKPRYEGTPESGFAENREKVATSKKQWKEAQKHNKWPVNIILREETPLERYCPYTVPSTSPKIDDRPDQSIIDNPNNYFPISEFKIRIRNIFSKKINKR